MSDEVVRCVLYLEEPPIGWLLLDNSRRKNAISLSMWRMLSEGLERLAVNPEIRVIVLAGADGRNFCAGGDISEFADRQRDMESVPQMALDRLKALEKPTIAMIDGYCLGGGMALAVSCDLRIGADNAQFGIPAAKRGVCYDYPMMREVVALVGPARAKLIMFTARHFHATDALRMGIVDEIVPAAELKGHVTALAEEIAANAPLSVSAAKFIINVIMREERERDQAACSAKVAACVNSADYAEATRSFMEKRPPVFTGS